MESRNIVFILVLMIVAFCVYKVSGSTVIENWWVPVPFTKKVDRVCGGQSSAKNNQRSLVYNQNQIVNTSLLDPKTAALLNQSISAKLGGDTQASQTGSAQNNPIDSYNVFSDSVNGNPLPKDITTEGYQSCSSCEPKPGFPVYTVPGTFQADLSPRFNPNGLQSYVKYNAPPEEYQASYPNDPLTVREHYDNDPLKMAQMVETPTPKNTDAANVSEVDRAEQRRALIEQGNEVANKLPVSTMSQGGPQDDKAVYQCADRYIFALQKSRLYALADPIRGDIPVIPCLPNRNPASNTWFRPSSNPRVDLNAGALNVIGGIGNVTSQQVVELMANAQGSGGIINGVDVNPQTDANTAFVLQQQLMNKIRQLEQQMGMANTASQSTQNQRPPTSVSTNVNNLVSTSAFS
ncbi:hypothetical protein EBZ80_04945 [bacterium]|nr:hypothetical protein [bacterium]